MNMFDATTSKQPSAWHSACERFAASHVLAEVARGTGIREQVLRNKLNPDQPHRMTVDEMIAIYHATGDETLIDGALFDCGLTAVKVPPADSSQPMVVRAVELNARVAGLGTHALQVTTTGRVTRGQRNSIVDLATVAMGELAILINDVEQKYQTVPVLGSAIDALRGVAGV